MRTLMYILLYVEILMLNLNLTVYSNKHITLYKKQITNHKASHQ